MVNAQGGVLTKIDGEITDLGLKVNAITGGRGGLTWQVH